MEDKTLDNAIEEHMRAASALAKDKETLQKVRLVAQKLAQAYKQGGKLIIFGNGGSAADAQHTAAELSGKFLKVRQALPAIALTANTSDITAIGNDLGYGKIFRRPLEAWAGKNDVVIGLSTSGNSANVIEAIKYSKERGIFCASFVGSKKCKLDDIADATIKVPSESTPRIQEMHMLLLHTICEIVENSL